MLLVGMLAGPVVLCIAGGILESFAAGMFALALVLSVFVFFGGIVMMWVFLLTGSKDADNAANLWFAGNLPAAIALAHRPLRRVFRADVRMKCLHVLGLCAEASGDFAEAEELFGMAFQAVPAMAAPTRKRHAHVLQLSHRAIALVALGRLPEADMLVRQASAMYPQMNRPGMMDAFTDDANWGMGAVALNTALTTMEPGRDPRAMLALTSIVLLSATQRPREALDILDRERGSLVNGLLPRERELVAIAEGRARAMLGPGGPMRVADPRGARDAQYQGAAMVQGDAAWARRILPDAG
jgi:hypothetical protein